MAWFLLTGTDLTVKFEDGFPGPFPYGLNCLTNSVDE